MNREIARLRPANVRRVVLLAEPSKPRLLEAIKRRSLSGEIERTTGDIHLITEGPRVGYYAVRVVLLPPRAQRQPDPAWAVGLRNAGIAMVGLAALVLSVLWTLNSLEPLPLVIVCGTVLGALALWCWAKYGRRAPARGIEVNVSVHSR
jgi:hypothetical protein